MSMDSENQSQRTEKTTKKTSPSSVEKKKLEKYSNEVDIEVGDVLDCDDGQICIFKEYLSDGRYGKVFRMTQRKKPKAESFACKIQPVRFESESDIHRFLSHKHIVKFLDSFCSNDYCFIFMEYCKNGTLRGLVRARNGLTVFESRYFFHQIMLGVKYIHKMKIIHRDLKQDNILLAENMQIKIGDFGLAKHADERPKKRRKEKEQNRNYYKAPELFNGEYHSIASDIWATGVILYIMVFNREPFKIDETFMNATEFKFDFGLENDDDLYDVLTEIFQPMHLRFFINAKRCLESDFLRNSKIPKKLPDSIRTEAIHEANDSDPSYEL